MMRTHFLCFCFFIWIHSASIQIAQSSVHQYTNKQFSALQNGFTFYGGSEGMKSSSSRSTQNGVADGRSYIGFDSINFKHISRSKGGLIQVIIFEVSDKDNVGGRDALCCTSDLAKNEGCDEGKVIIKPSLNDPHWPFSISINLEANLPQTSIHIERVNITKTGFYNVFFVFCDPELKDLIIDGSTIWKNPSGYLPGSMAPLLSFYGKLSLAYMLLGLAWFLSCLRNWKDLVQLHKYLTLIIALGMCETTLWYFDYANFNSSGFRPIGITIWAVTIGAIKKVISRVLMLAISMGYSVVRLTLGAETLKIAILGGTYFLAAEALDIFENVGAVNDLSGQTKIFFVFPVAILDGIFIIWIFASLSKTLEKLQAKKWMVKLNFYRKLTNTLSICVMIAVAWIGYEFYFKTRDANGEEWRNAWMISAFWSILTLLLLSFLCTLWAPSQNSEIFECSDDTGRSFDEEDAILLTSIVSVEPHKSNLKDNHTKSSLDGDKDSEDNKRE